jgi:hypothetical protein
MLRFQQRRHGLERRHTDAAEFGSKDVRMCHACVCRRDFNGDAGLALLAFDCVTAVCRWESIPVLVCSDQVQQRSDTQREAKLVSLMLSADSCRTENRVAKHSDGRTRPMCLQRALAQQVRDELSPRYRPSGELVNPSRPSTCWTGRPDRMRGILLGNHRHNKRCVCLMHNDVRIQSVIPSLTNNPTFDIALLEM